MDGPALFEQARIMIAIGEAGRGVAAAELSRDLAARIAARRAMCAATATRIAFAAVHAPDDVRPATEMAVNEYSTLGDLLATASDHTAAREAYDRAVALAEVSGDASLYVRAVVYLASQFTSRGAFAEALAQLLTARDAAEQIEPDPTRQVDAIAQLTLKLAEIWRWLGDEANARIERESARALLAALLAQGSAMQRLLLSSRRTELLMEDMLANVEAGWIDEAARAFEELKPIYKRLNKTAEATLPYYEARIAEARGHSLSVLAQTDIAIPDFASIADLRPKMGVIRALRARAMLDLGQNPEALIEAEAAVENERAHDQRETIWKAHWRVAQAREANNNVEGALAAYDEAVAAVDGVRRTSLGYRLDNSFLRERRPVFDAAITLAARRGDAVRVARYCDAIKSRFLGAALARGAPPTPPTQWIERLDALGAAIDALGPHESPERRQRRAERAALIERRRLEMSAADQSAPAMLDVEATLASLGERAQAALGLFRIENRIVATLLFEGEAHVAAISLDLDAERAIQRYAANLAQAPRHQSSVDYDPARVGLRVEALLPSAFVERVGIASSLLISAHEELNLLPWAMLPFGDRRLCEVVPVGVVPNLTAVASMAARPVASARISILGAPDESNKLEKDRLRATGPEIEALTELYRERGTLNAPPAIGPNATLDRMRELNAMPDADGAILHLSCHGQFEADDPAGSGLILTDRTLTAAEIATRPLRFAEVTLSACSTALRPTVVDDVRLVGDDVVGLPASFLEAGASALLVSITPAGDAASADLQLAYHRRRIAGETPLRALATAQRNMLTEGRHRVRDWAGFCLYGCN